MSVTIKSSKMNYKDSQGNYVSVDVVAERSTEEIVDVVRTEGTSQMSNISTAGATALTNIQNKADEVTSQLASSGEMEDMIADTFEGNKNYAEGKYIIHTNNQQVNKLYKYKQDHAAGNWSDSEVSEVKLGDDVSDLKSALSEIYIHKKYENTAGNGGQGTISLSGEAGKTLRIVNGATAVNVDTRATSSGSSIQTIYVPANQTKELLITTDFEYIHMYYSGNSITNFYIVETAVTQLTDTVADIVQKYIKSSYKITSKSDLADFNDAPDNSVGIMFMPAATAAADIPAHYPQTSIIQGYGLLITLKQYGQTNKTQMYIPVRGWAAYGREYTGTWSDWHSKLDKTLTISNVAADAKTVGDRLKNTINQYGITQGVGSLEDFDDAPDNTIMLFNIPASTDPSNIPDHYPSASVITGVCLLMTIAEQSRAIKTQIYYSINTGTTWSRIYANGAWYETWNVEQQGGGGSGEGNYYTCLKDGTGDFSSLVTAVNAVTQEENATLFVGPGEWDIISELGQTYMSSVSSSQSTWGLVLKNNVHIIGTAQTVITAKYNSQSPNSANVKQYFSAFNAGAKGFTLENLTIETDYTRYTIHDDRGSGGATPYTNRYINCRMKHTNGQYSDCIGGGLGVNGTIEITNCYFEGNQDAARLVYYHGNNYGGETNAQCKLIATGNYFAGLGTFGLTKYGDSTKVSTAYVSNNSVGSALFLNSGSYAPNDNMEMIEWNNVVRN